ncbi:MAG: tRNA-guanine transglycosylase, partial [Bacteroidales bacterium]|nr:tRNA-guanine transglycosylase [Bacteroidales bacterium]
NKKWAEDFSAIDPQGTSFVDKAYSKAYLRHMFVAGEMLGAQIASSHNLAFYLELVAKAREHIAEGDFKKWKEETIAKLSRRIS